MIRFFISLAITFFFIFLPSDSNTAAWTQVAGEGQLIFNFSGYSSSAYYDENSSSNSSSIKFTKFEINPFFEFGITENLTVGINPTIQNWNFEKEVATDIIYDFRQCGVFNGIEGSNVNAFMMDAEIFARQKIYSNDNFVFSLQPLVKLPCVLYSNGVFIIAEDTVDFEIRALGGYGFKWEPDISLEGVKIPFAGQYHFINTELAYRKRNEQFSDQIRFDATIGMRPRKDYLILGQLFSTFSTEDEPIRGFFGNEGLFVEKDDYYSVKLQTSLVKQMTNSTAIQFGVFKEVLGKNAGDGIGATVSLWYSF